MLVKIEKSSSEDEMGMYKPWIAYVNLPNSETLACYGSSCVEAARALEAMLRSQEIARRISPT